MSLIARVTYTTSIDATGHENWRAHAHLARPYTGLSLTQTYQQQLRPPKGEPEPLTDSLSVTADTLDQAREHVTAALEALTGLNAYSTRYIDLREHNASPAAVEEFKIAAEKRKAA